MYPDKFIKYGQRVDIKEFYNQHPVNPSTNWLKYEEDIEIPTFIPFQNESRCRDKPMTILTTIYDGLGKMAPIRRNPE